MADCKTKKEKRTRRHNRLRKKISGTVARPRLSISFSITNGFAQLIDDENGRTIVSASTLDKDFPEGRMKGMEQAAALGEIAGKKALASGISLVVFDRGGFRYHGRVKCFADAARKAGLQF